MFSPWLPVKHTVHRLQVGQDIRLWKTVLWHGDWCKHPDVVQERAPLLSCKLQGHGFWDEFSEVQQWLVIKTLREWSLEDFFRGSPDPQNPVGTKESLTQPVNLWVVQYVMVKWSFSSTLSVTVFQSLDVKLRSFSEEAQTVDPRETIRDLAVLATNMLSICDQLGRSEHQWFVVHKCH